ncbi:hypothetical protein KY290_023413 [Solanum tuberosum]|uniref:Uncharacterized protein n=1 Tax=Solanum tuberosum TaxID=4113 RepID=A0ABQ7V773_SOLTU|nr:hypothetical protein KY285_022263 [Solanum tuberosum]KAH0759920.1 hypothetical protein KY290_023413 [Solanum tuberosum]
MRQYFQAQQTVQLPVQLQLPRELTLLPFSTRQQPSQDVMPLEENKCSGNCKAIVRRIVEQELKLSNGHKCRKCCSK